MALSALVDSSCRTNWAVLIGIPTWTTPSERCVQPRRSGGAIHRVGSMCEALTEGRARAEGGASVEEAGHSAREVHFDRHSTNVIEIA
jgi:hypothetical protein